MRATSTRPGPTADDRQRRELAAFAAAPFVSVALWLVATLARLAALDGPSAALADLPALLVGGATYGSFAAVAATILLAGPLYALLVMWGRITAGSVLLGGALVGCALASVLSVVGGSSLLPWWVGGGVGTATAAVWWLMAAAPHRPEGP